MLPIIQIGPFALQTPGLILLIGLWVGITLSEKHASRFKIKPDEINNLVFVMLLFGIIGARLALILRFPEAFMATPINIFSLNPSLFDFSGGILISLVSGYAYTQRKKIDILQTLDALVPMLATCSIAFSLSNLASGSAFGSPSSVPWVLELWGSSRHPTQIYHLLIAILIMWLAWPPRQPKRQLSGALFTLFASLSTLMLLVIEGFRGDSPILSSGIRINQVYLWLVLLVATYTHLQIIRPKTR